MKRNYYQRVLLATVSMLVPVAALGSESDDLQALMALLNQETELVTRTRMNADYVPGMITVLYGEDARRSGKRTVADALADVAGVFLVPTNSGDLRTIVRGMGATQNANNLKFLLDNMPVNRATDGSADWLLRMPIEQVDRIEVIRGPGSAVHGGFAFSGVVNVIPRQGSAVNLMRASQNAQQGNVLGQYRWQNGVALSLNLSNWEQGNSGMKTGPDRFPVRFSNAPGLVYDHQSGLVALARLQWQEHQLGVQHALVERGPGFGRSGALPAELQPREETFTGVSWNSRWAGSDSLALGLTLAYQETEVKEADFVPIPAGLKRPDGEGVVQETAFLRLASSDHRTVSALWMHWDQADHQVYGELSYAYLKVKDASNTRTVPGKVSVKGPEGSAQVVPGANRTITSLTLQDQWHLGEALEMTMGMRYDRYSDHVAHVSPRLAVVWRPSGQHLFKAQFAEAFRPPTLMEANPGSYSIGIDDDSLKEEVMTSTEASYIHRVPDYRLRLTVFDTRISDQIEYYLKPGEQPRWRNRSDIRSRGLELEWQQNLSHDWQWQLNATWLNARDLLDEDKQLLGAANLVGNMAISWTPSIALRHTVSLHSVGDREGHEPSSESSSSASQPAAIESRGVYAGYVVMDYALFWTDVAGVSGMNLTLACLNVTDRYYDTPSSPDHFPQGLRHGGRQYQAGLTFSF